MSNENEDIIRNVSMYIYYSFKVREEFISISE
jgi:hypothetical protein